MCVCIYIYIHTLILYKMHVCFFNNILIIVTLLGPWNLKYTNMQLTVKYWAWLLLWGWFTGGWIIFWVLSLWECVCVCARVCARERERVKNNARCMSTIFTVREYSPVQAFWHFVFWPFIGVPLKTKSTMLVRVLLGPRAQKTSSQKRIDFGFVALSF